MAALPDILRQENIADDKRRPFRGRLKGISSSYSSSISVVGVSGGATSGLGILTGTGDAELLVEGVVELLLSEPLLAELLFVEVLEAGLTLNGLLLPELRLGETTTAGGWSTIVIVVVGGGLRGGGLIDEGQLGGGLNVEGSGLLR